MEILENTFKVKTVGFANGLGMEMMEKEARMTLSYIGRCDFD